MTENTLYPGRLINNLTVKGEREDAEGYILLWDDEKGDTHQFSIKKANCGGKGKLKKDDLLPGPAVVLGKIENRADHAPLPCEQGSAVALEKNENLYEVALNNYHENLRHEFCSQLPDIPWKELLKTAYSPDLKSKSKIRNISGNKWEVRLPSAVMPLTGSPYLNCMKGKHFFFPVDFMRTRRGVYRPQADDVQWPLRFICDFSINQRLGKMTKKVKILLHGTIDPLKLHFNLWKHLAEDKRVDSEPGSRRYWNQWSGVPVPEDMVKCFTDKCVPYINADSKKTRCDAACEKDNFSKVNKELLNFNNIYLSKAVTFFRNHTTLEGGSNCFKIIKEGNDPDMVNFYINCQEIRKKENMFVRLHLRGHSFNWHEAEPLIHLHILTFYLGPDKKKKQSERYSNNKTIYGKILNIKEVK